TLRNPVTDSILPKNDFAQNFSEKRKEILKMAQDILLKAQAR
ncbi:hypothetical protein H310_12101, partial [Aphanomyces invadans]